VRVPTHRLRVGVCVVLLLVAARTHTITARRALLSLVSRVLGFSLFNYTPGVSIRTTERKKSLNFVVTPISVDRIKCSRTAWRLVPTAQRSIIKNRPTLNK
jgi:hypothetical protein